MEGKVEEKQQMDSEGVDMTKDKKTIYFLVGIIIGIMLSIALIGSGAIAKTVKEPLGKWYISTYSASCNTPSGTHNTSSGAYATAGRTAAVDKRNPLVPMGSWIYIKGIGKRHIEDYGGFGRYNGGRRAVDVFTDGKGYLVEREVWLIRKETAKEKKKRIADLKRERERSEKRLRSLRQRCRFKLIYDPDLAPYQIVTDPEYIKGGTVQIGYKLYDVVGTEKGLAYTIKVGNWLAYRGIRTRLNWVCEEAVG